MKTTITAEELDKYVGKKIDEICGSALAKNDAENHCAHFVSHVLEYTHADSVTCKNKSFGDKNNANIIGANLRVDRIFNMCEKRDLIDDKNSNIPSTCLIFVTTDWNFNRVSKGSLPVMREMSQKHIGIYVSGSIYHYGNSDDEVKKDSIALFRSKFKTSYRAANRTVVFYYGTLLK